MTKQLTLRWDKILLLLLILIVVSLASMLVLLAFGGVDNVRAFVAGAGSWGSLAFIFLKICSNVIAPLSGAPLIVTGSVLFGTWEGLIYLLVGDLVGGNLNFWIARRWGRPGIRRFVGVGATKQVDAAVRHAGGWRALVVASLVFSVVYDFISYAAGLSNLRYAYYFWITLLSCIPTTLFYFGIGSTLATGPAAIYLFAVLGVATGLAIWILHRRAKTS